MALSLTSKTKHEKRANHATWMRFSRAFNRYQIRYIYNVFQWGAISI